MAAFLLGDDSEDMLLRAKQGDWVQEARTRYQREARQFGNSTLRCMMTILVGGRALMRGSHRPLSALPPSILAPVCLP